jgi:hypothetical protein
VELQIACYKEWSFVTYSVELQYFGIYSDTTKLSSGY